MKDGDVWSANIGLSVFSFYLDILRVDSPATDFMFSFSITLLNVVFSRNYYDVVMLNKSFFVSLAVGSCQDIFFVDDDTTAPRETRFAPFPLPSFYLKAGLENIPK